MKKPQNIVFAVIFVAAAAYVSVKGFIYYKVKTGLDDAVAMAAPFAEIEYKGISSTLDGSIGVEDISVYPAGIADQWRIDAIELEWPNFTAMLNSIQGLNGIQGASTSGHMAFTLQGLHLSTTGGLARRFNEAMTMAEASSNSEFSAACDPLGTLGPKELTALGFSELVIDAGLDFNIDESERDVDVQLDFELRDIQRLSMGLTMTGATQPAAMMLGVIPRLKKYVARFNVDPGFADKTRRYCAGRRNQSVEEYLQHTMALIDGGHATMSGFLPGPGLRKALKHYLKEPGEVLVQAHPIEPLDLSTLAHYKPEDIVKLLDLTVNVAGETVYDLSFASPVNNNRSRRQFSMPGFGATMSADSPINGPAAATPTPRLRQGFVATGIGELDKYVGRKVRLYIMSNGPPRIGKLVSLNDGQALVEQRVHSGKFAAYVPVSRIKKAEVFRVVEP